MGVWKRFVLVFKVKANKALDKAENPLDQLDYAHVKQRDLVQKVRVGLTDVATSRKRLEMQIAGLVKQQETLDTQARAALSGGREDLAREALTRKSALSSQVADCTAQLSQLSDQEAKLTTALSTLERQAEAFGRRKEVIKANYSAAKAQIQATEAFTSLSGELGDAGLAITRAEEKTAQMVARSGAIDELTASGALPDALGRDPLTVELERMTAESSIEDMLALMKSEQAEKAALPATPRQHPTGQPQQSSHVAGPAPRQ